MIAVAPAAAASRAWAVEAAAVPAEPPAITGTAPSPASATVPSTSRRSAASRLPASPIVPVPTMPWTPASSRKRTLAARPAVSPAPLASNGVVTAGMMPGKRMGLRSVEGHVLADAPDVSTGVRFGGVAVAVGDRLVDHAVLGEVDGRVTGRGDRVVAQPLPQGLVHQRRDVAGDAGQDGVAGQLGD